MGKMFDESDGESDTRTEIQDNNDEDYLKENSTNDLLTPPTTSEIEKNSWGETQPLLVIPGGHVNLNLLQISEQKDSSIWLSDELSSINELTATLSSLSENEEITKILFRLGWAYSDKLKDVADGLIHIVITDSCELTCLQDRLALFFVVKRTPKLLCAMALGVVIIDSQKLLAANDNDLQRLRESCNEIIRKRHSLCAHNWLHRTTKPDPDLIATDMQHRIVFQVFNQELSKGEIRRYMLTDFQAMKKWAFDLNAGLEQLIPPPLLHSEVYIIGRLHRPLGRQVPLLVRALGSQKCKFVESIVEKPPENELYNGSKPPKVLILSETSQKIQIGPIFTGEILFSLALEKVWTPKLDLFRCD